MLTGPLTGDHFWFALKTLFLWFYFDNKNYAYFARYVAEPLYLYMLILNPYVLYKLIRPELATEKYCVLMKSAYGLVSRFNNRGTLHWSGPAKIALLSLGVKAFYVPLLCSWTINNVIHLNNLFQQFHFNFWFM